jgi:DNA/RNA-binding domain of Phe-tRNA-synthetase-like protein
VADPTFRVHVDPAVHAAHPDYVALVLVAAGLANGPSDAGSEAELAAAEAQGRASRLERATDHPHIASWRAAFSAFGAKPSRYPSSAEALISRVSKGQPRGVTCRRWNWRQGRRTQLTADTTRAFFVFDRLDGLGIDALYAAADQLSASLQDRWPDCRLDRLERRSSPVPTE